MSATPRELDVLGARAWPPLEEVRIGDWRLRFAGGVTGRANSVLPLGPEGAAPPAGDELAARIAAVEHAYRERGLPPRFQLTASAWPPGLANALVRRGYAEAALTLVMTATLADVEPAAPPGWELAVRPEPSSDWLDTWWMVDGRGGAAEFELARAILARIEQPCLFVECRDGDGIAGVGLGVLDGAWLGIYCMATLPRARRRGCARAVLGRLAADARAAGARRAHLAVTSENAPAQRLYRAVGFEERQRYSYFTLAAAR